MSNGFDPRILDRPAPVTGQHKSESSRHTDSRAPSPAPFIALGGLALAGLVILGAIGIVRNGVPGAGDDITTAAISASADAAPSASIHKVSLEHPPLPNAFDEILPPQEIGRRFGALKRRQTLSDVLDDLGVRRDEANSALAALFNGEALDPRKLRPGLSVEVVMEGAADHESLRGLIVRPADGRALTVARSGDGYRVRETKVRLRPDVRRVVGVIETSLYQAAITEGARDQQVVDFAQIFAYDVDFQREIRRGDRFEMVFEAMVDERGRTIMNGELLYAELNGRFTDRAFYRFTPSDDGITDYFDPSGESARKFLMKTPINGARLSSRFGLRRHPISGYSRMHKGTDFAAPTGTPVYAAGNGTVERASRYGGYGKYVRIQHANGYETAYAHLSRYGPGVTKGKRVNQGDIIGYVGSTGASTGPHLHYEVLVDGKQVDAMSLKLPTGRQLDGAMLNAFEEERARIDALRGIGPVAVQVAAMPGQDGGLPN